MINVHGILPCQCEHFNILNRKNRQTDCRRQTLKLFFDVDSNRKFCYPPADMYKLLLCWRYLLTRFIAFASVVSVMLGVATMIVVNAVMLGFATEMTDRIQGILSDVIVYARDMNRGFPHYEWHREQIFNAAGELIEEITPVVATQGFLHYQIHGTDEMVSHQVNIVGIDTRTQGRVSRIAEYLQHPENRRNLSFNLHESGYDIYGDGGIAHRDGGTGNRRVAMERAGWEWRRHWVHWTQLRHQQRQEQHTQTHAEVAEGPVDPFPTDLFQQAGVTAATAFDPAREQHDGIIVGIHVALGHRGSSTDPETGRTVVDDHLML